MTLAVDEGLPGARALLIVDQVADVPGSVVRGAQCHLALTSAQMRMARTLDAAGTASISIEVPANAGLQGLTIYAQWFVEDSGGPMGVAATDARAITLFGN